MGKRNEMYSCSCFNVLERHYAWQGCNLHQDRFLLRTVHLTLAHSDSYWGIVMQTVWSCCSHAVDRPSHENMSMSCCFVCVNGYIPDFSSNKTTQSMALSPIKSKDIPACLFRIVTRHGTSGMDKHEGNHTGLLERGTTWCACDV